MITARPTSNATSIPLLTEVVEVPTQLTTAVPVTPPEMVPAHLTPEPVAQAAEPLVMRTRNPGTGEFAPRLVDLADLQDVPALRDLDSLSSREPTEPEAAPAAVPVDEDALAEQLRQAVLADLHTRIEPVLRERMLRRLEPLIATIVDETAQALRDEMTGLVDEAIQKAMIKRALGS